MISSSSPAPSKRSGVFVVLEGGDGAGKSTQAALLGDWIRAAGREVVMTREPGGTELGKVLREALLHGNHVDPRTEALLFATDRSHHVASLIRPALERGAVVVSDRYMDSSIAYQGAARALGLDEIRELSMWGTYGLVPDLTVVLDVEPGTAAVRREYAPDRMEREAADFHARVRATFLELARQAPDRYLVLDGSLPRDEIHDAIVARLSGLLGGHS